MLITIRILFIIGACLLLPGYGQSEASDSVTTASNATAAETTEQHDDWIIKANKIPSDKKEGIVTLEFKQETPLEPAKLRAFYVKLRGVISDLLNKAPPVTTTTASSGVTADSTTAAVPHRFRREPGPSSPGQYTPDDVTVVSVKPEVRDKQLRTSLYVNEKGGGVVNGERLNGVVQNNKTQIGAMMGAPMEDSHVGLPDDIVAILAAEEASKPKSIWEAHFWLFMALLIFACIGIILLLLLCLCWCCRRARTKKVPITNKPIVTLQQQKPLEEEPLVASKARPAMAEQSPSHEGPSQDEDNGWIIPLDQLTQEELEQTEAPVSKL